MAKRIVTNKYKSFKDSDWNWHVIRIWAYNMSRPTEIYAVIIPNDAKFEGV